MIRSISYECTLVKSPVIILILLGVAVFLIDSCCSTILHMLCCILHAVVLWVYQLLAAYLSHLSTVIHTYVYGRLRCIHEGYTPLTTAHSLPTLLPHPFSCFSHLQVLCNTNRPFISHLTLIDAHLLFMIVRFFTHLYCTKIYYAICLLSSPCIYSRTNTSLIVFCEVLPFCAYVCTYLLCGQVSLWRFNNHTVRIYTYVLNWLQKQKKSHYTSYEK